jgi:hypothetical protein
MAADHYISCGDRVRKLLPGPLFYFRAAVFRPSFLKD